MARIPIGNMGNAVPGRVRVSPEAMGAGVAQATAQLGQVGEGIALDSIAMETRRQAQEKAEQDRQAEMAERAREATALQETEDQLVDLRDEINEGLRTGTLPKDQAETTYNERSAALIGEAAQRFRPESAEIVMPRLNGRAARIGNEVRRAKADKDRADITADLGTQLEGYARKYRTDPAGATASAMAAIEALGPFSNLSPEQRAKAAQKWKEDAQYTHAFEAVSAGRNDRAALGAAEKLINELPDLDPQRRAVLMDRAASYRLAMDQKAEIEAARRQRQAEAALKRAEANFTAAQALADKGILSPEYADQVAQTLAGTPYQAAFRAMVEKQRETGPLAAQPVTTLQATLNDINAQIARNGITPALEKRRTQVEGVLKAAQADYERDPLPAAAERGLVEIQPLNMSGGIPGVAQQLSERVQAAQVAAAASGRPVSPLTASEAEGVARMLTNLPPDQKGAAVATLAATMSPQQAAALARQLDKSDKPLALALAAGASRTTEDRTVAELILRGAQVVKDRGVKEDKGAEIGLRSQLAKEVGDALPGQLRDDVIEAARLIYLGKQGAGETVSIRGALALAIGGPLIEHAGRKVPAPAGMDAESFTAALTAFPAAKVPAPDGRVYLPGGASMSVAEFLTQLPSAQLEPTGRNRYAVRAGGALVLNNAGRPIVLDMTP